VALLEEMLDAMSASKLNALYLHLTDDNCWPLEVLAFPLLTNPANCSRGCRGTDGQPGQYYSQAQIRALVAYAADRGIRVIPEVDSPGHFNTEHCYPELLTLGECPCPGAGSHCKAPMTFHGPPDPSKPELWAFFRKLYQELASLFPDPYVSLGGDEAWLTPWTCSPPVESWMKANSFDTAGAARFYERQLEAIVSALIVSLRFALRSCTDNITDDASC